MGFTTGLLGGSTLTITLVYLSMQIHTRNRLHQSALLRQQSLILRNIVEPLPQLPTSPSREVPAGIVETAKDKWNSELEREVRALQNYDWDGLMGRIEDGVSVMWRRVFQKSREVTAQAVDEANKQIDKVK